MTSKPNDVPVSRELLERVRQRLIDLNQIADFGPELFELLNRRAQSTDRQVEPVAVMYEDGSVLTKADCIDDEVFAICCKVQTPLYRHAQPATAKVDGEALEKLKELVSAVRSINRSPKHEVRVIDDDEPCYAQRKEWVEWLLSICDDADEVARLNTPQ